MNDRGHYVAPATISKSSRKRLCEIDDDNCMLVEFPNNEGEHETGFLAWLTNSDATNIDEIINEEREIEIYWPMNCKIQPKRKLSKTLTNANFSKVVAIIKARGDWLSMRQQLKSIKNTGKLEVSKGSRKMIKKRKINTPQKCLVPEKHTKIKITSNKIQDRDFFSESQKKNEKLEDVFNLDDSEEEMESEFQNYVSQPVSNVDENVEIDEVENEDEDKNSDEYITKSKGSKETDTQDIFNEKNNIQKKSLKIDSSRVLTTLHNKSDKVKQTLKRKRKEDNYRNDDMKRNDSLMSTQSNEDSERDDKLPEGVKRHFPLPKTVLSNLPNKSIQSYVSAMVDNFFETSYLKVHSVTGIPPNSNKNAIVAPPLHPPTMNYIRDCVTKVFGCGKGIKGKVSKTVSDKISTARGEKKSNQDVDIN